MTYFLIWESWKDTVEYKTDDLRSNGSTNQLQRFSNKNPRHFQAHITKANATFPPFFWVCSITNFHFVSGYPTEVSSTMGKVWTELLCTSCARTKNTVSTVCAAFSTLKIGQHGDSKMRYRTTTADTFTKSFPHPMWSPLPGRWWWDTNR